MEVSATQHNPGAARTSVTDGASPATVPDASPSAAAEPDHPIALGPANDDRSARKHPTIIAATAAGTGGHDAATALEPANDGRSARKRRAIMAAATTLFLRNGYQGTSMDDIAAMAAVSKQTVYKNFADKERLFTDIILGITASSDELVGEMTRILHGTDDIERALTELARRYLAAVLQPQVLQLRRLIIAEADRFPELARIYYQRAPERGVRTLASAFDDLAGRGLLRLDDPLLAAGQFAYLVLSIPQDKAMFCPSETATQAELVHFAEAGVRVFLAAYGPADR